VTGSLGVPANRTRRRRPKVTTTFRGVLIDLKTINLLSRSKEASAGVLGASARPAVGTERSHTRYWVGHGVFQPAASLSLPVIPNDTVTIPSFLAAEATL